MKTQEEIKQLAEQWFENSNTERWGGEVDGFIQGYKQALEDNKEKKYTEDDIRDAINVGISSVAGDYPNKWSFKLGISLEDYFIYLLNK